MREQHASTQSVRAYWNKEAARYDRMMSRMDRLVFGRGRAWVCRQATGRTLEVAIGTGRNLELYDPDVPLVGFDLSPEMLALARRRAADLDRDVDLREADAERQPFDDGEFDTVTCTLSLCAVPDLDATMTEIDRVLRPGGRLLLLDHVRPTAKPLLWLLTLVQWGTNRFAPGSGEQYLRRPLEQVEARGYEIEHRERSRGGAIEQLAARKPA